MFKLVICDDEGKTTIVPLIRDEITIGRKEGNTIRLTDRNVSRQHARLVRHSDDAFLVTDLSSRNGTKVNGDPVKDGKARKVIPGDQIYIGDYNLSIRTDVSAGVPMGRQMDPGDTAGIGKVTPHARLVMIAGPDPGSEYDLTVNLYVIGRSEEANLRIDDPSISRAHARVDGDEQQWTISDLDSINGIVINGTRRDDYLLKSGDVIELGIVRLRFVAPGEPYEYTPADATPVAAAPPKGKSGKLFLVLGIVAVVAAAVIAVALFWGSGGGGVEAKGASGGELKSYDDFVEAGKDQMQAEAWAEAARLFAEAQQRKPDDAAVRELKNQALAEMEAQAALVAALAAEQAKNWRDAVDGLAKIPRSSRYYDAELLRKMAAELCKELVAKGAAVIKSSGDLAVVEKIAEEIGGIPEASAECKSDREALLMEVRRDEEPSHQEAPQGAGTANPYGGAGKPAGQPAGQPASQPAAQPGAQPPKKPGAAKNPYDNPYASGDSEPAPKPEAKPQPKPPAAAAAPPAPAPAPASGQGFQADDSEAPPSEKGKSKMTWDTP